MNPELVYSVTNIAALAAWVVLVCYPLRREPILFAARSVAAVLSMVYVVLLARSLSEGGAPDFTTLAGVSALFAQPDHAVVGWLTTSRSISGWGRGRSRKRRGADCPTSWCCPAWRSLSSSDLWGSWPSSLSARVGVCAGRRPSDGQAIPP